MYVISANWCILKTKTKHYCPPIHSSLIRCQYSDSETCSAWESWENFSRFYCPKTAGGPSMLKCIQSETDNIWLTQQQLHKQSQGNVMYALDKLYLKEWYLYKTGVFFIIIIELHRRLLVKTCCCCFGLLPVRFARDFKVTGQPLKLAD